jgi:mRNA interferase MazF
MKEWLSLYAGYLAKEKTFKPITDTIKYEPGTILAIELGYNPGSEHGGNHFAVVVEDNSKSSPVVMVVPLGSAKPGKSVHFNDVDLGEIPEINKLSRYPAGTKSIATVSQMRCISKLRINAPLRSGDQIIKVPLKDLYDKIQKRFTTKGLNKVT